MNDFMMLYPVDELLLPDKEQQFMAEWQKSADESFTTDDYCMAFNTVPPSGRYS